MTVARFSVAAASIAAVALTPAIAQRAATAQAPAASAVPAQGARDYGGSAPVAYLIDMNSGAVLFSRDAERQIPPASQAKMMTAYVIFDLLKRGELSLDKKITFRPESWEKWHGPAAGSTMFLSPGESVSVENLLHGVITLSGNDACVALAEGIAGSEPAFAELMNKKAKEIGLANSHFGTSNGWPDNGVTVVTAKDLATLAKRTIEDFPDLYVKFYQQKDFTWGKTMGGADIAQANRNPILGRIAGADGLKTGHTEEAGYGFTGSAEQNGRRLIEVVAGLDSYNGRIEEATKLMDWGFKAWQAKPLYKKGAVIAEAKVQQSDARRVAMVAPHDLAVTMPSGTNDAYTMKVVYEGPIKAPFKAGDRIGSLVVTTPSTGQQVMPLVAGANVGKAGFLMSAWNGLMGLFGA